MAVGPDSSWQTHILNPRHTGLRGEAYSSLQENRRKELLLFLFYNVHSLSNIYWTSIICQAKEFLFPRNITSIFLFTEKKVLQMYMNLPIIFIHNVKAVWKLNPCRWTDVPHFPCTHSHTHTHPFIILFYGKKQGGSILQQNKPVALVRRCWASSGPLE